MKLKTAAVTALVAALLLLACFAAPVSAAEGSDSQTPGITVMIPISGTTLAITDYAFDCEVYEPNEEGIITVTITNNGAKPVKLENIFIKYYEEDNGISSTKANWRNLPFTIAPSRSLEVPVPLKVGDKTGNFYATICVQTNNGSLYDLKQPFVITVEEQAAALELTNIKVKETGKYYTLTGDLHNLGYTTAYSLHVTSREGGDIGPYVTYPIGNLDADDLAGFEITFIPPQNGILTLVTTYKDSNHNTITEEHKVNLENHLIVEETDNTGAIVVTVIAIIIAGLIVFLVVRKIVKSKGKKH
ncbi:MAG TPA: hypothetical protein O0X84_05440 [Methanocorpusculum sp.]|nr:hypothetical protein [Methanocorpusculum sp.]